jgi:hypothetical protein
LHRYKNQLIYGSAFLFWGIIAFVEVAAYESPIILALSLHFMTSVVTLLALGSKVTKFKPEEILNLNDLKVRILMN